MIAENAKVIRSLPAWINAALQSEPTFDYRSSVELHANYADARQHFIDALDAALPLVAVEHEKTGSVVSGGTVGDTGDPDVKTLFVVTVYGIDGIVPAQRTRLIDLHREAWSLAGGPLA